MNEWLATSILQKAQICSVGSSIFLFYCLWELITDHVKSHLELRYLLLTFLRLSLPGLLALADILAQHHRPRKRQNINSRLSGKTKQTRT